MDSDVIVVGAGIAGSEATRQFRSAGHRVLLVDQACSNASQAALCALREAWQPTGRSKAALRYALHRYRGLGAVVCQGAWVSSWRRVPPRRQEDFWAVDPRKVLMTPDQVAQVVRVEHGKVSLGNQTVLSARLVLVAGGAEGSNLSGLPPDPVLWGTTLVGESMTAHRAAIHTIRPYLDVTVLKMPDGQVRIGSTKAQTPEKAELKAWELRDAAEKLHLVEEDREWETVTAPRAMRSKGAALRRIDDQTFDISGFGRTGFSVAPGRIMKVVKELCSQL